MAFGAYSQSSAPKYSNEFLNIGVGARALGMANVQVGLTNDVTSGYWNPSGLTGVKNKYEVSYMHAEWFSSIGKYDYLGFATPIDSQSVLGISAIRFGVDNIPDTRFLFDANGAINYSNIKYFSASDYAFLVSYVRKVKSIPGLSLGGNIKIIYRNVGEFANAWGFGLDFGAQYKKNGWLLGAMLKDATSTFNLWTFNANSVSAIRLADSLNTIPSSSTEITVPRLILGGGKQFTLFKTIGIVPAIDLIMTFDGRRNTIIQSNAISIDPALGFEADYKKIVYLRAGVGNTQYIKKYDGSSYLSFQPSFGIGVKIYRFALDYALTKSVGSLDQSLYSNVFSLKISLF
ncbi:MAG: PorV/PorQ family protein [Cytophagales bacterium]|nr:PorV/PorQ family protein [Cytophagales bacterium]